MWFKLVYVMQTLEKTNLVFSKVCIEMTIVEKQYSRCFHSEGLTIFRETFFFFSSLSLYCTILHIWSQKNLRRNLITFIGICCPSVQLLEHSHAPIQIISSSEISPITFFPFVRNSCYGLSWITHKCSYQLYVN